MYIAQAKNRDIYYILSKFQENHGMNLIYLCLLTHNHTLAVTALRGTFNNYTTEKNPTKGYVKHINASQVHGKSHDSLQLVMITIL